MINIRTLPIVTLAIVLSTHVVYGQGRPQYRDFQLGDTLPSVSARAGVASSAAKTIHLRPALMQELEWRSPYFVSGSTTPQTDPVRQIVFSFYDDQLSKMVVDYDRDRTAGLTDADLIEALSTAYGPPLLKPVAGKSRLVVSPLEEKTGTLVARWGDADYSVVLYRASDLYRSSSSQFRVIVTSPRLEALARSADAEAVRLDQREAPQREIARQKKEVEDARQSQEKARISNKAAFRP
jgi:hypothetical protein